MAATSPKVHPDSRKMVLTAAWCRSGRHVKCNPARRRLGIIKPACMTTPAVVPSPSSSNWPRSWTTPLTDAWRTVVPKTSSTTTRTRLLAMGVNMGAPNLRLAFKSAVPSEMKP